MAWTLQDANIELHCHPFMGNKPNLLVEVIEAMDERKINIAAFSDLYENIFPSVLAKAEDLYEEVKSDEKGVILPGKKLFYVAENTAQQKDFIFLLLVMNQIYQKKV